MLSIIAAAAKNNVIGINNDLPWKLSGDLKYFAKTTTGKSVLMGRKTFLSIFNRLGKPLPNRKNYVLSRTEDSIEGAEIVKDIKEFLQKHEGEDIFVIGGASVFETAIPMAGKLYITEVDCEPYGDVFFPKLNMNDWKLISEEKHEKDEKNEYNYNFKIYERK
jgi:dihydrofolate reductase